MKEPCVMLGRQLDVKLMIAHVIVATIPTSYGSIRDHKCVLDVVDLVQFHAASGSMNAAKSARYLHRPSWLEFWVQHLHIVNKRSEAVPVHREKIKTLKSPTIKTVSTMNRKLMTSMEIHSTRSQFSLTLQD